MQASYMATEQIDHAGIMKLSACHTTKKYFAFNLCDKCTLYVHINFLLIKLICHALHTHI